MTFATEPGSYGYETARFSKSFPSLICESMSLLGSMVSVFAIASTCPVATSRTTASAALACEFFFAFSSFCCTKACRSRSRVSLTFLPSEDCTSSRNVPGMTCPSAETSSVDRPSTPVRVSSPAASNPNCPWPSMETLPTTFSAMDPFGYCRMSWWSAARPWYSSAMSTATSGSTLRTNTSYCVSAFSLSRICFSSTESVLVPALLSFSGMPLAISSSLASTFLSSSLLVSSSLLPSSSPDWVSSCSCCSRSSSRRRVGETVSERACIV